MTCPTGNLHLISARLCNVGALMSETARLKLRQHPPKSSTPTTGHGISILCASSRLKISSTTAEWDKFSKIVSHILQKMLFFRIFRPKAAILHTFLPPDHSFSPKAEPQTSQLPHLSACKPVILPSYPLIPTQPPDRPDSWAPGRTAAWVPGRTNARLTCLSRQISVQLQLPRSYHFARNISHLQSGFSIICTFLSTEQKAGWYFNNSSKLSSVQ